MVEKRMTPINSNQEQGHNGNQELDAVADDLRQQSEKLRQLADRLQSHEQALAEMQANYPHLRDFAYARLREEFARTQEELPDKDLETIAQEEGALPLEAFIAEIERPAQEP
jgi:hypothetical protein